MVLRRTLTNSATNRGCAKTLLVYLTEICVALALTVFAGAQAIGLLREAVQQIAAADDTPVTDSRVLDSFAMESFIYRGPPSRAAKERKATASAAASRPASAPKPKAYAATPTPFAGWSLGAQPQPLAPAEVIGEEWAEENSERDATPVLTYRTVCVRLCDGYYFPISYATTPDHFAKDSAKCEASCGSPARLYVYENPGSEAETMEDLAGRPYSELKTAFLYRTEYVPSCSCKAQPWEQEAQDRHRLYALADTEKKVWSDMSKSLGDMRKAKQASKQAVAQLKAEANAQSTALKAEMKSLEEKIAEQKASRAQAAVAVVAAKGIDVSSGKKKRFAAKRSRKVKGAPDLVAAAPASVLGAGAVQAMAPAGAAATAAPPLPPATWGQPMALGGAKPKAKIWGNGPNAHTAPKGTGAGDEFRRNFY